MLTSLSMLLKIIYIVDRAVTLDTIRRPNVGFFWASVADDGPTSGQRLVFVRQLFSMDAMYVHT